LLFTDFTHRCLMFHNRLTFQYFIGRIGVTSRFSIQNQSITHHLTSGIFRSRTNLD